jgi:hypothetical protein
MMELDGPPFDMGDFGERQVAWAWAEQQLGRCLDYLDTIGNLLVRSQLTTDQYELLRRETILEMRQYRAAQTLVESKNAEEGYLPMA